MIFLSLKERIDVVADEVELVDVYDRAITALRLLCSRP